MKCSKVYENNYVCIVPDGAGRWNAVLRRRLKRGYNILEQRFGVTKKQAQGFKKKWTKELKAEKKFRVKRKTPYP